ncbi:MAG: hypothetical protein ACD_82C00128G0001 [uncultured bacterium]|nr:MAG: hypothetical protein ACD_82C00128G0001 [uncultured bacterium]KKP28350.1 MAG: polymerase III, subunit gamma and tau protein [candidate division TM6 bacterium GW2011_GWF2_30_66]
MNIDGVISNVNLNLARKWRSKSFDQIIGQELSVRILKNSLYLNQFFPVYLFSGQRGCGKTSTARIFAAAVNCVNLPEFQKNPKNCVLPCLECASCRAILEGNHPDFIEIDAASNTGVDNVRQIIESSSFMPLIGIKKIYLVDEAHMLSKAAFNAFLKIMEEPPESVIFILATTNSQKIIETVKSRSLQLFFGSVENSRLEAHLKDICEKEKISHDNSGISAIVSESQGSVRDALNILEQVRFSASSVTKISVQNILGHIDDDSLIALFECLLNFGVKDLLNCIKTFKYELFSPQYLWKKIIDLTRDAIWIKHGVLPNDSVEYCEKINKIIKKVSFERLNYIMLLFYENESIFVKTTEKHSMLECLFIQITKKNDVSNKSGASSAPNKVSSAPEYDDLIEYVDEDAQECGPKIGSVNNLGAGQDLQASYYSEEIINPQEFKKEPSLISKNNLNKNEKILKEAIKDSCEIKSKEHEIWCDFIASLGSVSDPLLNSIFSSGEFVSFDRFSGILEVKFAKKFSFFQDSITEKEKLWMPILQKLYSQDITFKPSFTGDDKVSVNRTSAIRISNLEKSLGSSVNSDSISKSSKNIGSGAGSSGNYPGSYSDFKKNNSYAYGKAKSKTVDLSKSYAGKSIDVSDVATWKKANTILKYFSGNIVEFQNN